MSTSFWLTLHIDLCLFRLSFHSKPWPDDSVGDHSGLGKQSEVEGLENTLKNNYLVQKGVSKFKCEIFWGEA